jgi:hypothetical protein
MTSEKFGAKGKKKQKLLKPGMLMLAAMFIWSAAHEPDQFTIGNTAAWLLGAVTVALVARAAFALASPIMRIIGIVLGQALHSLQSGAEQ